MSQKAGLHAIFMIFRATARKKNYILVSWFFDFRCNLSHDNQMKRVLVTAFEPYDIWTANASWLALIELTRDLPSNLAITTRLYPVNFTTIRERLEEDLSDNFDVAIHLGQDPGSTAVQLESTAVNVASEPDSGNDYRLLVEGGPPAFQADLGITQFAGVLESSGLPVRISHHAGTFLCNAVYYLSNFICKTHGWKTKSLFIHVPLDTSQTAQMAHPLASMPAGLTATALRLVLNEIALQE